MYTFDARIRYSEVDSRRRLTVEKLIDYFQDCTTFQSEDLGVGLDFMTARGIAWVINYWQIQILRRPQMGEPVKIGTQPYEFKGLMGQRNFLMETQQGERLALANSVWTLLDMKKNHLDTNKHMNNAQYVHFAVMYLPADAEICELRVEYRKQAVLGDVIVPVLHHTAEDVLLVSMNDKDGKPYAVVEMKLLKEGKQ